MVGQGRVRTGRLHGLLCLAAASLIAGAASAEEETVAERVSAYRACPGAGVSLWISYPSAQDASGRSRFVEARWAGEPDWIAPPPVPDEGVASRANWLRPPSVLERHRTVRAAAGRPVPSGGERILLFQRTEHWAWYSESTIAVRRDDGGWDVDYLRLYDDGTQTAEAWSLADADVRRLNGLVGDPCLAREPFQSDFALIQTSDNTRWTLEVEGRGETIRIAGKDSGFGRAGGIVYLLRNTQ